MTCCPHCGKQIAVDRGGGGLTRPQAEALGFIRSFISERSYSPSYREIGDHLGLVSVSGVSRIVGELEDRGRIRRMSGRARAIEIVGQGA